MRPVLALLLGVSLVGCERSAPVPPKPTKKDMPVALKPTTAKELDAFLADQKGKVVIVDCWFHG